MNLDVGIEPPELKRLPSEAQADIEFTSSIGGSSSAHSYTRSRLLIDDLSSCKADSDIQSCDMGSN